MKCGVWRSFHGAKLAHACQIHFLRLARFTFGNFTGLSVSAITSCITLYATCTASPLRFFFGLTMPGAYQLRRKTHYGFSM